MSDFIEVIVINDNQEEIILAEVNNAIEELTTEKTTTEVIEIGITGPQGASGEVDITGLISSINSVSPSANNINISIEGYESSSSGNGILTFTPVAPIVPISVSLAGGSQNEVGSVVNSVNLTWVYNEGDLSPDTSQELNEGIGVIPLGDRSYTYSTPISSDKTFTITAVDSERGTDTSSTSVTFNLYKVYWGTFNPDANLTESDIEALVNSELRTNRNKTLTDFAGGGNRIVYAYPTSFGLATVRDGNGFIFQDWYNNGVGETTPYIVSVTNSFGVTADYYVYQSFNRYFGLVTFSWS